MVIGVHDGLVRVALSETLCIGLTVDIVLCASILSEMRALNEFQQQINNLKQESIPRELGYRP